MKFVRGTVTLELTKLITDLYYIEDELVRVTDTVKLEVSKYEKHYTVECYRTGDVNLQDSYVVKVYFKGEEIGTTDVDSEGGSYDNGLSLEDEEIENAIMDILFNDIQPIVEPF